MTSAPSAPETATAVQNTAERRRLTLDTDVDVCVVGAGLAGLTTALELSRKGMDLVSTGSIRSGAIAAYLELRDNSLVQAQAQIDQLAASMSSALSDQTTVGTAATSGAQSGFDLDLAGLQTGNVAHISYKDNTTGVTHNLSIVRVDDPSVLPLSNSATVDPNDEVLGIDFSGGMFF